MHRHHNRPDRHDHDYRHNIIAAPGVVAPARARRQILCIPLQLVAAELVAIDGCTALTLSPTPGNGISMSPPFTAFQERLGRPACICAPVSINAPGMSHAPRCTVHGNITYHSPTTYTWHCGRLHTCVSVLGVAIALQESLIHSLLAIVPPTLTYAVTHAVA